MTSQLRKRALDEYSDSNVFYLDPELMKWDSSIFTTEDWEICVRCANYFSSQSFRNIYDNLPVQLIHGDMTPNNIIVSGGVRLLLLISMQ